MTPAKLNVFTAFFPYGGNGASSCEHPNIREWYCGMLVSALRDERIGNIGNKNYSDTPITMTRNAAVFDAMEGGYDVLVMCDSDQAPDILWRKDPLAKQWWPSSFDFLYKRRMENLLTVVGAPYCGPPPFENVYVFQWARAQNDHPGMDMSIDAYTRQEAAAMAGIGPVAALPTGLIMFDLSVFRIMTPPFFYYEYTDSFQREKASTEDVAATRDISLHCWDKFGYSPIFCNWDAWAGHWKPKCVSKPRLLHVDEVGENFQKAVLDNRKANQRIVFVGAADEGKPLPNGVKTGKMKMV